MRGSRTVVARRSKGTRNLCMVAPRWRFEAEHVAVGPDIADTSRNDAAERAKLPRRQDGQSALALAGPRWEWEHLWPVDNYQETPRAVQSLTWTNWPLFTVGMVQ